MKIFWNSGETAVHSSVKHLGKHISWFTHIKSHSLQEYSSLHHAFILLRQSKQTPLVLETGMKISEVQFLLEGLFRNVTSVCFWLKIILMSLYKYIPTLIISLQVSLELNFLFLLFPLKKKNYILKCSYALYTFNYFCTYIKHKPFSCYVMYWYSWFTVCM